MDKDISVQYLVRYEKMAFLPLFFLMFLDFVGVFMVLPLFTPVLFGDNPFLGAGVSYFVSTLSVGLLVAFYGLGQFFGGPFLGELSDEFGRKKVYSLGV